MRKFGCNRCVGPIEEGLVKNLLFDKILLDKNFYSYRYLKDDTSSFEDHFGILGLFFAFSNNFHDVFIHP